LTPGWGRIGTTTVGSPGLSNSIGGALEVATGSATEASGAADAVGDALAAGSGVAAAAGVG